jgi:hypothetical protein
VFLRSEGTSTGYSATTLGATQDDATSKNGLTASAGASGVSGSVGGSDGTHTHGFDYIDRYIVMPGSGYGSGTAFALSPLVNIATNTSGSGHGHNHSLTASAQAITVGAGDAETRPVNVGVYYLIKLYDNLAAVDVYIPSASAGVSGLVDTGVQSFAGVKTFNDGIKLDDAVGQSTLNYYQEDDTTFASVAWKPDGAGSVISTAFAANITRVGRLVTLTFPSNTSADSSGNSYALTLKTSADAAVVLPIWARPAVAKEMLAYGRDNTAKSMVFNVTTAGVINVYNLGGSTTFTNGTDISGLYANSISYSI